MESSNPMNLFSSAPFEEVSLPGGGAISTKGLALLVGPNPSGKTQLLKDIDHALRGGPIRQAVVAAGIKIAQFESILDLLADFEQ